MSLPFPAAGRGGDGLPTPVPEPRTTQPSEDYGRWRRPYQLGPWRVAVAALLLLLTSYVLFSALILAMAGTPATASAYAVLALILTAFAGRLLRVGVWISSRGIRQSGMFTTNTLGWPDIAAVRTAQQPVRWLGLPLSVQGQALLVIPWQGTPARVLLTDHNADFLTRPERFTRAADVVQVWAAKHP